MLNILTLLMLASRLIFPTALPATTGAETIPFLTDKIRQDYQAPVSEYGRGHRGIDLEIALNQPILAPESGTLIFKDSVVDRPVITLLTASGKRASFEPVCSDLPINASIKKGEVLGFHCQPEDAYKYHCDSCVHVSARSNYGYLSPLYLMGKEKPSVLKP